MLFPGDGFAYSHYHEDGHCGLVAEEAVSLDLPDVSSTFADLALFWTKFADMNVYCDRLDHLIERLGVKTIAPTHGLPITDVKVTVPKVQEGLKAAALMPESGTNEKVAGNAANVARIEDNIRAFRTPLYCAGMSLVRITSLQRLISRLSSAAAASGVHSSAG